MGCEKENGVHVGAGRVDREVIDGVIGHCYKGTMSGPKPML
jgi:hypothetical protein